jgi:SAM-dependent methyltransferase
VEELIAIEPSKEMIDQLQARVSPDTRVKARNDFFTNVSADYSNYFDSIVYVNVLEHIEDHAGELARVYEALKPGGHVCIFVPALPWLYSEHDKAIGHHRRYYKKELTELVKNAGFSIVTARYFNLAAVIPWLVVFKWLKRTPKSGTISVYDNYVVPVARVFESVIPLPLGNNLILVGKK